MATNVGGTACDIVNATVNALATALDLWTVAGLNGIGAMDFGANKSSFVVTAVKYDTSANIETWFATLRAMQGYSISIETGPGSAVVYSGLLVIEASRGQRQGLIYEGNDRVRGMMQLQGVLP